MSFSYGGGEAALEHVNLTILSGQTVGIIGGTGSGKSTLVNLLPRFYNVTGGKITIDGIRCQRLPSAAAAGEVWYRSPKGCAVSGQHPAKYALGLCRRHR